MQTPPVQAVSHPRTQFCSPTRLCIPGRFHINRASDVAFNQGCSLYYTASTHFLVLDWKTRNRNVARRLNKPCEIASGPHPAAANVASIWRCEPPVILGIDKTDDLKHKDVSYGRWVAYHTYKAIMTSKVILCPGPVAKIPN